MARHVTASIVFDYYIDDEEFDDMSDEDLIGYLADGVMEDLSGINHDSIAFDIEHINV